MLWQRDGFEVDIDRARLDFDRIHELLRATYWAAGRSRADVEKSWAESDVVFGLYDMENAGKQVGCCRVLTDTVSFAWLADVVIDPAYRGRGLGEFMIDCVTKHPPCANVVSFLLGTRDAHGLYRKFGWETPAIEDLYMVRANNPWWKKDQP